MNNNNNSTKTGSFVIGATLGAIAGVALGSLLIPKKTKEQIKEKVKETIKNGFAKTVNTISEEIFEDKPNSINTPSKLAPVKTLKKRLFKGIKRG